MAAQNGRDLLLKIDMTGDGLFETMAGLRATRLTLNAQSIDVTHLGSGGWREVLGGAGVRSAAISGSGVFRDAASDAQVRTSFFDQSARVWRLVVPDFGQLEGPFIVAALEYAGEHDGEAAFALSLASAGAVTFTAI